MRRRPRVPTGARRLDDVNLRQARRVSLRTVAAPHQSGRRSGQLSNGVTSCCLKMSVACFVDAIASGMLRASPAIADRLAQAESELVRLKAAPPPVKTANVERLIPEVADHSRNLVGSLEPLEPRVARGTAETVARRLVLADCLRVTQMKLSASLAHSRCGVSVPLDGPYIRPPSS
jgi:hypothetical protein